MEKLKQNNLEEATTELGFVKVINANATEKGTSTIALQKKVELEDSTKVTVEGITPDKLKSVLNEQANNTITFKTPGENYNDEILGIAEEYNKQIENSSSTEIEFTGEKLNETKTIDGLDGIEITNIKASFQSLSGFNLSFTAHNNSDTDIDCYLIATILDKNENILISFPILVGFMEKDSGYPISSSMMVNYSDVADIYDIKFAEEEAKYCSSEKLNETKTIDGLDGYEITNTKISFRESTGSTTISGNITNNSEADLTEQLQILATLVDESGSTIVSFPVNTYGIINIGEIGGFVGESTLDFTNAYDVKFAKNE